MGSGQSRIEPNHVAIYKKILMIREPATCAQTLQTLMSGQEYVNSARTAGIYPQLLQYIAAVNSGRHPGLLPGSALAQAPAQQPVEAAGAAAAAGSFVAAAAGAAAGGAAGGLSHCFSFTAAA